MKKTARNKPVQITITKSRKGYKVFSQSLKHVENSRDGLDLQAVSRFVKSAGLRNV